MPNFIPTFLLLLLVLPLLLASTPSTHNQLSVEHLLHKNINVECCLRLGGVVCGTTFPSCCSGGCRDTWYGGVSCYGNKLNISSELCPNSCKNVCRRQGGIICGTSVTKEECCEPQFCTGLVFRSCDAGTRMPMPGCVPSTTFSKWSW
jgi:hypothetical protein